MFNRILITLATFIPISCYQETVTDLCNKDDTKYYEPATYYYNPAFPLYPDSTISIEFTDMVTDTKFLNDLQNEITACTANKEAAILCDCSFIELGFNTCGGGIEEYIIFSEVNTDVPHLLQLASYYRAYDKLYKAHYNIMNTCIGITQPNAALLQGECTPYFGNSYPINLP